MILKIKKNGFGNIGTFTDGDDNWLYIEASKIEFLGYICTDNKEDLSDLWKICSDKKNSISIFHHGRVTNEDKPFKHTLCSFRMWGIDGSVSNVVFDTEAFLISDQGGIIEKFNGRLTY